MSNRNNLQRFNLLRNKKYPSTQRPSESRGLPAEVLYIIFDHLNVQDLLNCGLVCKEWNKVSNHNAYWIKWAKKFKCHKELVNIVSSNEEKSFKVSFKKIFLQRKDLLLFKLGSKFSKTNKNNYTNLPALKTFMNEVGLSWSLDFLGKNSEKVLFSINATEINSFEASLSIIWSNLSDINLKRLDDLQIIRVYLTIDVYLDLASGVLQTVRKKTKAVKNERGQCLINCKRISVLELKCTAKHLRDKKSNEFLSWKKIHQDTSIELFSLNEMFLVGAWNGNNDDLAFIAINTIFTTDLIEKIFSLDSKKELRTASNLSQNLELDPNYGLHDYTVYMNIRNQTRTSFISFSQHVYKACFSTVFGEKHLELNVIDCDLVHAVGHKLTMLPKLSWSSEGITKNQIDLLAIVDLCIFDSDMNLMISECYPLNIVRNDMSTNLTSDETFQIKHSNAKLAINASIACLKDEYSSSSTSDAFHLNSLTVNLNLDFVNKWFGTKLKK